MKFKKEKQTLINYCQSIYIYVCYILQDLNYTVAKMLYGVLFRRPKSVLLLFVHLCFHNNSYLLFKILETVF